MHNHTGKKIFFSKYFNKLNNKNPKKEEKLLKTANSLKKFKNLVADSATN